MKTSQFLLGAIPAVMLAMIATASASTAPKDACSVLSLAEVRVLVASPVVIFRTASGSSVRGQNRISNCTYVVLDGNGRPTFGRNAVLSLMWGSHASLAQIQQFYEKRHKELPSIKGDVLVLASVTNATQAAHNNDLPASKKLLDAALAKL